MVVFMGFLFAMLLSPSDLSSSKSQQHSQAKVGSTRKEFPDASSLLVSIALAITGHCLRPVLARPETRATTARAQRREAEPWRPGGAAPFRARAAGRGWTRRRSTGRKEAAPGRRALRGQGRERTERTRPAAPRQRGSDPQGRTATSW